MRLVTRRKLVIVGFTTLMFLALWSLVAGVLGLPVLRALPGAACLGFVYGLYEEFYVQGRPGAWLRRHGTLVEIGINILVLVVLLIAVMNLNHLLQLRYDRIEEAYRRLPVILPILIGFSALMVGVLRVIGFVGGRNLVHLMLGSYRRPVLEHRLFLFLDMKDSTELASRLGPLTTRELIGKLFLDVSGPIYDHGGEIYRFTGDGLVATWKLGTDDRLDFVVDTIDDIVAAVRRESIRFEQRFEHVPGFRIGVHCGDVVVCEEGDMKRAIGYYGDTIHLASRLEQEAKTLGRDVLLSGAVASRIDLHVNRLHSIGLIAIRGFEAPVPVYALRAA